MVLQASARIPWGKGIETAKHLEMMGSKGKLGKKVKEGRKKEKQSKTSSAKD